MKCRPRTHCNWRGKKSKRAWKPCHTTELTSCMSERLSAWNNVDQRFTHILQSMAMVCQCRFPERTENKNAPAASPVSETQPHQRCLRTYCFCWSDRQSMHVRKRITDLITHMLRKKNWEEDHTLQCPRRRTCCNIILINLHCRLHQIIIIHLHSAIILCLGTPRQLFECWFTHTLWTILLITKFAADYCFSIATYPLHKNVGLVVNVWLPKWLTCWGAGKRERNLIEVTCLHAASENQIWSRIELARTLCRDGLQNLTSRGWGKMCPKHAPPAHGEWAPISGARDRGSSSHRPLTC